jgi:hypothetical protein
VYVESGEEALGEIARAIAAQLGLGAAQSVSAEEAIAFWGRILATFSLGSNGRVRGRAAVNLGWLPAHRSITRWIASDLICAQIAHRPDATNATPYCRARISGVTKLPALRAGTQGDGH